MLTSAMQTLRRVILSCTASVVWKSSSICFILTSKVFVILFSSRGTLTKCIERCCHKHSSCLTAELNGVPLCSLACVACKPPAVALHEAASLSGIHVWTGHNRRLCCQEKGWLGVPVFSICPSFYYRRQQRWKITGVSSQLPFVTLTKSAPLALRLQKLSSGLKQEVQKASSFLARLFLLKHFLWFDLVGWRAEVLFCANQTQHKVSCQKLCINLTDAPSTSSQCYVP